MAFIRSLFYPSFEAPPRMVKTVSYSLTYVHSSVCHHPSMMLFSLSGNLIHTRLASLSLGSVGQVGAGSLSLMLMTYFCTKCAQDPPPSRLNSYRVVFWEVIYRVILNIPFVFHPEYLFSPCSESQPQLRNYPRKKHFFKEKSVRSILKQIFFYICLLKIQDHFCC